MDISYEQIHAYLDNPTERQREELRAIAKKELLDALSLIVNNINKLKAKGLEEALFYNPGRELEKVYRTKEITKAELEANPLKAAYEKYVLPITYGVVNLSYPAVLLAILADIPPLTYEKAEALAIKNAEKYIEKIQKETGSNIDQIARIMRDFIRHIHTLVYDAYHKKEYNALAQIIRTWQEETARIETFIKEPVTDKENDVYYKQLEDLENEYRKQSEAYDRNIDRREQARTILAGILKRLYPGEVIKIDIPITEKIESPIKWENVMPMLQDPFTNALTWLKNDNDFIDDRISERYIKKIKNLGYEIDFKKFIINEEGNKTPIEIEPGRFLCSIRAKKLLDSLMIKLTKEHETMIKLPLNDYLDLFGVSKSKPSKDKIRIILKEDLAAINSIGFNYNGAKKTADFKHIAIGANSYGIKNGIIYFEFREDFANYIKNKNYITQYPIKLFKLDNRNSNAYYLGRKLSYHSNLYNNQKKGTADIIKVKTLLQVCDLISYEKLKKTSGAVTQKIIDPFEKALDSLKEGVLDQWEYCNAKKQPLNDEQLKTLSYEAFIERYIKFTLKDKPKIKEADETKKKKHKQKACKE